MKPPKKGSYRWVVAELQVTKEKLHAVSQRLLSAEKILRALQVKDYPAAERMLSGYQWPDQVGRRIRKPYSPEFKLMVIRAYRLAPNGQKHLVLKHYGVPACTATRWLQAYESEGYIGLAKKTGRPSDEDRWLERRSQRDKEIRAKAEVTRQARRKIRNRTDPNPPDLDFDL